MEEQRVPKKSVEEIKHKVWELYKKLNLKPNTYIDICPVLDKNYPYEVLTREEMLKRKIYDNCTVQNNTIYILDILYQKCYDGDLSARMIVASSGIAMYELHRDIPSTYECSFEQIAPTESSWYQRNVFAGEFLAFSNSELVQLSVEKISAKLGISGNAASVQKKRSIEKYSNLFLETNTLHSDPKHPKKITRDYTNAYLVMDANFTGVEEYPIIKTWMIANEPPKNIVPFRKHKKIPKEERKNYFIAFYSIDIDFACVKNRPEKYLSEFREFGGIIGFDFSVHIDYPLVVQKQWMYTNLALTYFYGNKGIDVIPNIRYGLDECADDFLTAIPKNSYVAISTHGFINNDEKRLNWQISIDKIITFVQPKAILVYGPRPDSVFEKFNGRTTFLYYEAWINLVHKKKKQLRKEEKTNVN